MLTTDYFWLKNKQKLQLAYLPDASLSFYRQGTDIGLLV